MVLQRTIGLPRFARAAARRLNTNDVGRTGFMPKLDKLRMLRVAVALVGLSACAVLLFADL